MDQNKPDRSIDLSGAFCPVPIMETNKTIKLMRPGELLEVISTDEGSKMDIPAWCQRTGHRLETQSEANGVYRYYVRKKPA